MTERSADYVAWRDAHRKVAASLTDEIAKRAALMGFAPKEHIDPRGGKEGDNKPATLRQLMSMRWWYALRPDRLLAEETTTTTPMFPIKSKKRDWREVDSELRKMFPQKGGNKSKEKEKAKIRIRMRMRKRATINGIETESYIL